jgi:hypothetical protein
MKYIIDKSSDYSITTHLLSIAFVIDEISSNNECSMRGRDGKCYRILVGKPERTTSIGRTRYAEAIGLKWILREFVVRAQ